MRTLFTAAILATASFATFAQAAPAAVADPAVQVQGKPSRFFMHQDDYQDFKGKYLMGNGKVLTLTNKQRRFFAQMEGQPAVEIVAVGSKAFVARGADMRLRFDEFRSGRNADVVLSTSAGSIASVSPEQFRTIAVAP